MFYSHEILTNRQSGVATIWLVATLGSKSNLKKVTRRAILDVDLLKACKTITEPDVPLALRLQGSLLFGVSRVFQQQCGYVLTDVTNLRDNMRTRAVALQDMELDPEVGKARPDQLNLTEDPYFLPDFDIGFDLSAFGYSSSGSSSLEGDGSTSWLSLPSSQSSSHVDKGEQGDEFGFQTPSLRTPAAVTGGLDLSLATGTSLARQIGPRADRVPSIFDDEPAIIEDPVFDVDDNGFLHPALSGNNLGEIEMPSIEGPPLAKDGNDGGRPDTEPLPAASAEDERMPYFNEDMMVLGDDEPVLHEDNLQNPVTEELEGDSTQPNRHASASIYPIEESSETADAPQRRVKSVKAIQPDRETELTNRALSEWTLNYLTNMSAALRARDNHVKLSTAKKNADFWVSQQGIGNVLSTFGLDRDTHPLAIFSGESLWDMLRPSQRGTKRSRTRSVSDEQGERHIRARTELQEGIAQGQEDGLPPYVDEDGLILHGDDFEVEAEVGRHAPPSLQDHSSAMPWNLSAGGSRQNSAHPPSSGFIPRLSSSVGALPGMELGPRSALSRRGSRLTSASPLLGRGGPALSRHSTQGPLDPSRLTSNDDELADLDAQLRAGLDPDFELYGPSATVDTQTAGQSQWVAATLENEAHNFLNFVNAKIQEKTAQDDAFEEETDSTEREKNITFEELLPPALNSAVVGAQALLHVLALTTKGLLEVFQVEHFGHIQISVVSH